MMYSGECFRFIRSIFVCLMYLTSAAFQLPHVPATISLVVLLSLKLLHFKGAIRFATFPSVPNEHLHLLSPYRYVRTPNNQRISEVMRRFHFLSAVNAIVRRHIKRGPGAICRVLHGIKR